MRMILGTAIATLAITGLAACGQSDEAFRTSIRTQALANCQRGADAASRQQLSQAGLNIDRLCTCVIDRYMRTASSAQLRQDANNPNPPAMQQASLQCAQEMLTGTGGAPQSTPVPTGNDTAAESAAPAEGAAAEGGENGTAEH